MSHFQVDDTQSPVSTPQGFMVFNNDDSPRQPWVRTSGEWVPVVDLIDLAKALTNLLVSVGFGRGAT